MRGPDYNFKDLIFYTGFFAGTIATYLALQTTTELVSWMRFLIGLPVGLLVGWVLLKAYESRRPGA